MKDACSEGFWSDFFGEGFALSEAFLSGKLVTSNCKHFEGLYCETNETCSFRRKVPLRAKPSLTACTP